jgi:hypothetical protein
LKADREEWEKLGHKSFPSAIINGVRFRGQFNPDNVFEAICSSFAVMPRGCTKFLRREGTKVTVTGLSTKELIITVFIVLTINLVVVFFYRRSLKRELGQELQQQVTSEVSRYVALSQFPDLTREEVSELD